MDKILSARVHALICTAGPGEELSLDEASWNRLKSELTGNVANQHKAVGLFVHQMEKSKLYDRKSRALLALGRLARRSGAVRSALLPRLKDLVVLVCAIDDPVERRGLRSALKDLLVRWKKKQWSASDESPASRSAPSSTDILDLAVMYLEKSEPTAGLRPVQTPSTATGRLPGPLAAASRGRSRSSSGSAAAAAQVVNSADLSARFIEEATERSLEALENATATRRLLRLLMADEVAREIGDAADDDEQNDGQREYQSAQSGAAVASAPSTVPELSGRVKKRVATLARQRELGNLRQFGLADTRYELDIEVPATGQAPVLPVECAENADVFETLRDHVRALRRFLHSKVDADLRHCAALIRRHERTAAHSQRSQHHRQRGPAADVAPARPGRRAIRRDIIMAAASRAAGRRINATVSLSSSNDETTAAAGPSGPLYHCQALLNQARHAAQQALEQTERAGVFVSEERRRPVLADGEDEPDDENEEDWDDNADLKPGYEERAHDDEEHEQFGGNISSSSNNNSLPERKRRKTHAVPKESTAEPIGSSDQHEPPAYVPSFLQDNPQKGVTGGAEETLEDLRKRAPMVDCQPLLYFWSKKTVAVSAGVQRSHRFFGESDSAQIDPQNDPELSMYKGVWNKSKAKK